MPGIIRPGLFHSPPLPGRSASQSYPASGVFLTIGTTNQTAFIKDQSLTLRLNTFDLTLVSPNTVPVVGDRVFLQSPEWDGVVVRVGTTVYGSATYVSVSASNTYEAVASPAPFGLSDTPDNVTTFGFADLEVVSARTEEGDETTGSCTVFRAGLRPGMTFTLTSVKHGLAAQSFTVQDATVTWPTYAAPVTTVTFGAPIVTMSVWVNSVGNAGEITGTRITDGSVTTPKLAANAVTASKIAANTITASEIDALDLSATQLTLRGPGGSTALDAGGFGPTWRRFITTGMYNSDFAAAPPDTAAVISSPNPLPFWTFVQASGTAITMTSVADTANGSGRSIQVQMTAGAAGDDAYIEQVVPVATNQDQSYWYTAHGTWKTGATTSVAKVYTTAQYLKSDGSTTTGTAGSQEITTTDIGATTLYQVGTSANAMVTPTDAAYLRVRVGFKRDAAATSVTETLTLVETRVGSNRVSLYVPDNDSPGTYAPMALAQNGGIGYIIANQNRAAMAVPAGSAPTLALNGSGASALISTTDAFQAGSLAIGTNKVARYVAVEPFISVINGATFVASDGSDQTTAEITDLPDSGVVAVQAVLIVSADSGHVDNQVKLLHYTSGGEAVWCYASSAAGYLSSSQGMITTGGTNTSQVKYRRVRGAGTVTWYLRVVGYWTTA